MMRKLIKKCQWKAKPLRMPPQPQITYLPSALRKIIYIENDSITNIDTTAPTFGLYRSRAIQVISDINA